MPLIEKDTTGLSAIIDLSEKEKERWRAEFGAIREKEQLGPAGYIDQAVDKLGGHAKLKDIAHETTRLIFLIRETAWNIYVQHEQLVCGKALATLLHTNEATRNILREMIKRDNLTSTLAAAKEDQLLDSLSHLVGELSGRVFPYQYELAKSVTQSRRSRAGKAFERIIRHVIDIKGFPCADQSKTGTHVFEKMGLGKIVDGLIPRLEQYNQDRTRCAILTMKTTLRERWQEVVEELHRTNVPHIYLLTLDEDINPSGLATMKNHNITLVAPNFVQVKNPKIMNLISFEQLFNRDLPHLLKWWEDK